MTIVRDHTESFTERTILLNTGPWTGTLQYTLQYKDFFHLQARYLWIKTINPPLVYLAVAEESLWMLPHWGKGQQILQLEMYRYCNPTGMRKSILFITLNASEFDNS